MGKTAFSFLLSFLIFNISQARVDYIHLDALGSASVLTGEEGAVAQIVQYEPFGESKSVSAATLFLFTGQESDESSGFYYYGARYADLTVARFISSDPIDPSNYLHDPQQLHRYGYARNNPLRYIDPTGEFNQAIDYEVDPETREAQQEALQKAYDFYPYAGMALEAYFDGLDAVANYPFNEKIAEFSAEHEWFAPTATVATAALAVYYISRGAPAMAAGGRAFGRAFAPVRTDQLLRAVRVEGKPGMERLEGAIAQAFEQQPGLRASVEIAARELYGAGTDIPRTQAGPFIMRLQGDLTTRLSAWYRGGKLSAGAHQSLVNVHAQLNSVLETVPSEQVPPW